MYTSHLQHRVHCLKLLAPLIHCLLAKLDEATLVSSQHAVTTYEDVEIARSVDSKFSKS